MRIEEDDEVIIQPSPELLDLLKGTSLRGEELQKLNSQLTMSGAVTIFQVHGFFCSVITAGDPFKGYEWFPMLYGKETVFNSQNEREEILDKLSCLKNLISSGLMFSENFYPLVDYSDIQPPFTRSGTRVVSNKNTGSFDVSSFSDEQKYNLTLWCNGYIHGINVNDKPWEKAFDGKAAQLIMPIIMLDVETIEDNFDFLVKNGVILDNVDAREREYNDVASALPDLILFLHDNFPREIDKKNKRGNRVQRNDPCPCGSGKKFKKCCV